jgi:hypothetical protein
MDESALWEKIPQGKLTVPLWYTTRVFPLWETQRAVQWLKGIPPSPFLSLMYLHKLESFFLLE